MTLCSSILLSHSYHPSLNSSSLHYLHLCSTHLLLPPSLTFLLPSLLSSLPLTLLPSYPFTLLPSYHLSYPPSLSRSLPPFLLPSPPLTLPSSLLLHHTSQATVNWQAEKFEMSPPKTVKVSHSATNHIEEKTLKIAKHNELAKEKFSTVMSKLYAPTHVRSLSY